MTSTNKMADKIRTLTYVLRYVTGTSWGCLCRAVFTLVEALIDGTTRYSPPLKLQVAQNVALRLCLGLPRGAWSNRAVAESLSKFASRPH